MEFEDGAIELQSIEGSEAQKLLHAFFELAEIGAETEDNCLLLMGAIEEWKEKIVKRGSICASNVVGDSPPKIPQSFDESRITSSKAVRRKGHAPFKRKMSRVDLAIKRKKDSTKKVSHPKPDTEQLLHAFQSQQSSNPSMPSSHLQQLSTTPFSNLLSFYNQASATYVGEQPSQDMLHSNWISSL